jgi:hypothetical protein
MRRRWSPPPPAADRNRHHGSSHAAGRAPTRWPTTSRSFSSRFSAPPTARRCT